MIKVVCSSVGAMLCIWPSQRVNQAIGASRLINTEQREAQLNFKSTTFSNGGTKQHLKVTIVAKLLGENRRPFGLFERASN